MYPNYPNKYRYKPALDVSKYIAKYIKDLKPAENLIIIYSDIFLKIANDIFNLKKIRRRLYSVNDSFHLYLSHIGAPAVGICIEEMSYLGYKNFISVGVAGYFGESGKIGDIVLCREALRDEGTSYHYCHGKRKFGYPSLSLFESIKKKLSNRSVSFLECGSWSTDAPYRETFEEFRFYRKKGLRCVDMESSALYIISEIKKVNALSVFIISDLIDPDKHEWRICFDYKSIVGSYKRFLESVVCS